MLAITEQTLTLIRIGQEQANYRLRQLAAARSKSRKPRLLNQDRRRHLVDTAVKILKAGDPTYFEFEASCRHGLRSSLCLQGWSWNDAENAAADVVSAALKQIGAVRPTWDEAQGLVLEQGATKLERAHCVRCSAPIPAGEAVAGKYCDDLCRHAAVKEKHRRSGEAMTMAELRLARAAARPAPKPCEQCGNIFKPTSDERRFCSSECAYASIRVRPVTTVCAQCGDTFSPKKNSEQAYCSHVCYAKSKSRKKYEARACVSCEELFQPASPHAVYCSKRCQARYDRARKAAKSAPRQCENCQTYFQSDRSSARFCGPSCSAIARSRVIRASSTYRCDKV
ncbi:hypothetical protein [Mesorhizobium sp. B2-7-2]|uniref:hypothetical protein n=1 Tax=Mesorhizobium sp. B2-7-2 TaxID=2589908 RepID=UPI001127631B|nr:hypothetical protein [Mesorhizobium sp. B2-7-2]TPJ28020.1 hypothetical protein FJ425_13340 [Mesorhizobium sp. B2-7-2]